MSTGYNYGLARLSDRKVGMESDMSGRLEGKCIVVTGAASGIGRASAQLFAKEGAKVVAVDISEEVLATVAMIQETGAAAIGVQADVGNDSHVREFISKSMDKWGRLDGVFANAGITSVLLPQLEQSAEDWERVLRTNLIGTFLTIKYAAPYMIAQGSGAIVCTASVAGLRAHAGGSAYSASKAGIISLVQTMAVELSSFGLRINAICPGLIETGMTQATFDNAHLCPPDQKIGYLIPMRRAGQSMEVAETAAFLLSDASSYVNGQAIAVDGGMSSQHPFRPVNR